MAFVGYRSVEDAAAALKYFNNTFMDTCRISIEVSWCPLQAAGWHFKRHCGSQTQHAPPVLPGVGGWEQGGGRRGCVHCLCRS
jgi:hypothetical protein